MGDQEDWTLRPLLFWFLVNYLNEVLNSDILHILLKGFLRLYSSDPDLQGHDNNTLDEEFWDQRCYFHIDSA